MAKSPLTQKIVNLIWEITCLLSGEDYAVVKKTSHERLTSSNRPPVPRGWCRTQKPIMEESPSHTLRNNEQKILELTNKISELLTGEVPVRWQDVAIYFTVDEWEYLEGHKDLYKDVMMVDHVQYASGLKVDKNKIHLTKYILNHILDFFAQLTGEQYIILKNDSKTLKSGSHHLVSGRKRRKLSSISKPQSHSMIHERNNEQKVIELTNKIIELLTGEVPIRCQDVSVYFSMEEWEYVVEHKEMYKDIMMENHQPLTSPEKNFPKNATGEKPERTNMREEPFSCMICRKSFKYHSKLLRHQIIHTRTKPYSYTCSECPKVFISQADLVRHHKVHTGEKPFICSECGKSFGHEWNLNKHQKSHIPEKPYKCSECIKCFDTKVALLKHQKIHSEDYPFSCSECGKRFMDKAHLLGHHKVHTGERPYPCTECGKSFAHKYHLTRHVKIHTGERLYPCQECGKAYICISELNAHQRIHMGKDLIKCSECPMSFKSHKYLVLHQTIHTGEKNAFCHECGVSFRTKNELYVHKKRHTKL